MALYLSRKFITRHQRLRSTHLAKASLAQYHEEVEVTGTDDVLFTHLVHLLLFCWLTVLQGLLLSSVTHQR